LSSALKLNGVTLPLDTVKEQLSAEQAHSTYNGTLSTGIGDVQSAPKRKHSCEDRIERYIQGGPINKVSSCLFSHQEEHPALKMQIPHFLGVSLESFERSPPYFSSLRSVPKSRF